MSAAERCASMDGGPDDPSWNELAALAGIDPPLTEPGDRFERDSVDIAMYWPEVRE